MKEYIKNLKIGDKVKVSTEKRPYKVVGRNDNFIICRKPFNLRKTYTYFIIDIKKNIRGADNFVFSPYDYDLKEDIDKCLVDLENGKCEVSGRNFVELDIEIV